MDSVRGTGVGFEITSTYGDITGSQFNDSFDPDGFTVNSGARVNRNGENFVAWCWKAGDSNVSNTDGTITSTVRANDTYGFSIVSYTGTGSTDTVGHGLSSTPDLIITKNRDGTSNWNTFHSALGNDGVVTLNTTSASISISGYWGTPNTSTFGVSNYAHNTSGDDFIAYCWSETTGYSKFGSWTGTGSTFKVTTGFKPSLIIVKRTNTTGDWILIDGTRDVSDPRTVALQANNSGVEFDSSSYALDFLDDGFNVDATTGNMNNSGDTYIYAAFADTREAAFWLDQSGNDNDWQPVNLDHNDTVADSPTDNFATWNPLANSGAGTYSDGNLKISTAYSGAPTAIATIGFTSGKYYWEVDWVSDNGGGLFVGVVNENKTLSNNVGSDSNGWAYYWQGTKWNGSGGVSYASGFSVGDTIGVAVDADASSIEFFVNGVSDGVAFTNLSGTLFPAVSDGGTGDLVATINFGQQPFKYDPPA